jgi:hypothetical protein
MHTIRSVRQTGEQPGGRRPVRRPNFLLDNLGERVYFPNHLRGTHAIAGADSSRHARLTHPQGRLAGAAARLWRAAADRANLRPGIAHRAGRAVSGAVPPGSPGAPEGKLRDFGEQSQSKVLRTDRGGAQAPARRDRGMEPSRGRDCVGTGGAGGRSVRRPGSR